MLQGRLHAFAHAAACSLYNAKIRNNFSKAGECAIFNPNRLLGVG